MKKTCPTRNVGYLAQRQRKAVMERFFLYILLQGKDSFKLLIFFPTGMTIAITGIERLTRQYFSMTSNFQRCSSPAILAQIVWSYFQLKCLRIASFTNEHQD